MKYNEKELKALPENINLEQLRVACHISKMTARYYVKSGLLPSICTGKKTRCYIVRKRDLMTFIKDYEDDPGKYIPPKNWYKSGGHVKPEHDTDNHEVPYLPKTPQVKSVLEATYKERLKTYPDLLNVIQIAEITGYRPKTVTAWCRRRVLKALIYEPKLWIPKEYLMEYLSSEDFNGIVRKSQRHLDDLFMIYHKAHNKNYTEE